MVLAIDRRTGKTVWERTANEAIPHEPSHPDNGTWASASAITDGEHVIASFDSFGYYAYDMNGTLVWQKDLGDKRMRNEFGEGSTPALHGNHLVVVWDQFVPGASFVTVLDKRTGQELWRAKRDEIDTWATPLVVEHEGRAQVIVNGMNRLRSYDLADRQRGVGSARDDDEPDSVAGRGRRHGVRDQRIPRQQPQSGPARGRQGRHQRRGAIAWTARSRHAVRAVAAAVRRHPLPPENQLRDPVGVRREERRAALSGAAARRAQRSVLVAGRRRRPRLHHRSNGRHARPAQQPGVRGDGKNTLDDGIDASPAIVDDTIYIRGYKSLYATIGN